MSVVVKGCASRRRWVHRRVSYKTINSPSVNATVCPAESRGGFSVVRSVSVQRLHHKRMVARACQSRVSYKVFIVNVEEDRKKS